jgi:hypothetical protein
MKTMSGMIRVLSQLLVLAKNDAEVAEVLGHEVAHYTLGHFVYPPQSTFDSDKIPAGDREKARQMWAKIDENHLKITNAWNTLWNIYQGTSEIVNLDSDWVTFNESFAEARKTVVQRGLCKDRCKEYSATADAGEKAAREIVQLEKDVASIVRRYYSAEEFANKKEPDADEVAVEFMARADIEVLPSKVRVNGPHSEGLVAGGSRGTESHPAPAWRIENVQRELGKHEAEYSKFWKKRKIDFMTGPSLAEVKQEIQAARKP